MFMGLISSLGLAFLLGAGWVILLFEPNFVGLLLVICGLLLTFIFSSIALGSFMAPPCEPAKEAIETVAKTPAISADKNLFMKISLRIG